MIRPLKVIANALSAGFHLMTVVEKVSRGVADHWALSSASLLPPTGPISPLESDGWSIPIWLGGSGGKAFDRAARLADGFIFLGASGIDHAVDAWKALRERVSSLGRSVEDFGAEYVTLSHGVDDLTSDAETWRAAGGTHMAIATMGLGLDSADAHVDYIASAASVLSLS